MSPISRRESLRRMALGGAVAPFWLSGCSGTKPDTHEWEDFAAFGPPPEESDLKGQLTVDPKIVNGINDLGWKLLPKLEQPNPFVSPASLALALGMLESGSDGKTRDELRKILTLAEPSDRDGRSWKSFANALRVKKPKRQIQLANALFLQSGYDLVPEFQKQLKESFLTLQKSVDFQGDPQVAAEAIDEWIVRLFHLPASKTVNMEGMTPLTRLVLVNLIHFQGDWDQRFDPALTKEAAFETAPGRSKPFPFMNLVKGEFQVEMTKEVRAIKLPFKEGDRALHVLLPMKRHGLNDLLQTTSRIDWNSILFGYQGKAALNVSLPKFLMQSELRLQKPLKELGLSTLFDPNNANLSRMSHSAEPLYVQAFIQQTQFLMNEEGARAAAVTKVPAGVKSEGPRRDDPFVADQPFLVALTDGETKTILFLGRVDDPQPLPK